MSENKLPLKGIKVVDFSEFVAAPVVAKLLADWGADVVKVERFEGDVWRWYGPSFKMPCQPDENPLFDIEHLKKKFISLNLKTAEGKEIMDRLLSKADVFVTSYRADALAKLNLSYEQLSAKYPRLIYAHLQGFGEKGPEADRPGFDVVCYWARSGAMLDLVPGECGVPITAPLRIRRSYYRSDPHRRRLCSIVQPGEDGPRRQGLYFLICQRHFRCRLYDHIHSGKVRRFLSPVSDPPQQCRWSYL